MLKKVLSPIPVLVAILSLLPLSLVAQQMDRTVLPIPDPQPPTITELDARNAKAPPRFELKAPKGAPNVVIVLLDDIGFGQPSAFGGPARMPTLDKLAAEGLRYNGFHTTALCSPTRMSSSSMLLNRAREAGRSSTWTARKWRKDTYRRPSPTRFPLTRAPTSVWTVKPRYRTTTSRETTSSPARSSRSRSIRSHPA